VDAPRVAHALRGIEDLERDEVPIGVEVEDDPGPGLVALADLLVVAQDHLESIRASVVRNFHDAGLQYRATWLVRYAVPTSGGWRSKSTKTRTRSIVASGPIRRNDCSTARPGRTRSLCSGAARMARTVDSSYPRRRIWVAACGVMMYRRRMARLASV